MNEKRRLSAGLASLAILAILGGAAAIAWYYWTHSRHPSKDETEQLLTHSSFFDQTQTEQLTLYSESLLDKEAFLQKYPDIRPFMDAGWVDIAPAGIIPIVNKPFGAKLVLTDAGEKAKFAKHWQRSTGSGGEDGWTVAVAQRTLVETSEPEAKGYYRAECPFGWTWKPIHPALSAKVDSTPKKATAAFRFENDKWSLEEGSLSSSP